MTDLTEDEHTAYCGEGRNQPDTEAAALLEDIEVLRKLAEGARRAETGCNRVVELLAPEWELFEKRDGSHNTYASRLYADHVSSARTNKRDADALDRIIALLERGAG